MSLTLFGHPLASFCHKVLIALYENQTPFTAITVDLADPESRAPLLARWPVGKIPVLDDTATGQTIAETSIIIEYLQNHYPGPVRLLPDDPDDRLQVRLWDRFFDLYVSQPMQKIVLDRLRPAGAADPHGVAEARAALELAYQMIEAQLRHRDWATGPEFSLADCAAAPALFYASIVQPFGAGRPALSGYFERLVARPSVARTLAEARPFFPMFPYHAAIPSRFLGGAQPA